MSLIRSPFFIAVEPRCNHLVAVALAEHNQVAVASVDHNQVAVGILVGRSLEEDKLASLS